MKIFRISSWEGQAGGAQLYIKSVNELLEKRGHETFTLNIVTEEPDSSLVSGNNIVVAKSKFEMVKLNLFQNLDFIEQMNERYEKFSPDIVTIHSYGSPFLQVGTFLKKVDVPIIFNAHDSMLVCPTNTLTRPGILRCEGGIETRCFFTGCRVGLKLGFDLAKRWYFDKSLLKKISAFICPSRSLAEYLNNFGYRPSIHLPSFVRDPEIIPKNVIHERLSIGYIGRLEKWKGVQYLLLAYREAIKDYDKIDLFIAGKGGYEHELRKMTRELGIDDRVKFLGNVTGKEKEDFFASVNVVIVPSSSFENHPLTAIEAQLRSRPVIGTDFGGIKEIVEDKKTGFIVPIGDHMVMAKVLRDLANNPDLIAQLGEAGRQRALTRFTPNIHIDMILKVYEKILRRERLDSLSEAINLL